MKMYEFGAKDYGDQIKKVYLAHLDLRGIWQEDVTNRTTAVGIWSKRSGWGFGWVDLLQLVAEVEGTYEYEPDEEGNPLIKRRYGLVKLEWKEGALWREKFRVWQAMTRALLAEEENERAKAFIEGEGGKPIGLLSEKEEEASVLTQENIDKMVARWSREGPCTWRPRWKGAEEDGE